VTRTGWPEYLVDNMTSGTRPTATALNNRAVNRRPARTAYITRWCLSALLSRPKGPSLLSALLRPH